MKINHTLGIFSLFLLLVLSSQSTTLAANDQSYQSLAAQMRACASVEGDAKRLKCFDSLVPAELESAGKEPVPEPQAEMPKSLPDNIGGGKFNKGEKKEVEGNRGVVTSCQQSHLDKWLFLFDNGQVWKQVDRVKRRYKRDCRLDVTVVKDGFGYKMLVDGKKGAMRIRRLR